MKSYTKPSLKIINGQPNKNTRRSIQTNLRVGTAYDQNQKSRDPNAPLGISFDNE